MTATKQTELYTCIGKGGEYARIGTSLGAGECRGEIIEVYRDTATGQLYHRETSDFFHRMEPVAQSAEPVQGEAVEVVAWLVTGNGGLTVTPQYPVWAVGDAALTIQPLYTSPAKPDAELVRQCIAEELATWEGDFQGPVQTAMRCLQVRIDAKLAELKS